MLHDETLLCIFYQKHLNRKGSLGNLPYFQAACQPESAPEGQPQQASILIQRQLARRILSHLIAPLVYCEQVICLRYLYRS